MAITSTTTIDRLQDPLQKVMLAPLMAVTAGRGEAEAVGAYERCGLETITVMK